jgi:hypothetical protein
LLSFSGCGVKKAPYYEESVVVPVGVVNEKEKN